MLYSRFNNNTIVNNIVWYIFSRCGFNIFVKNNFDVVVENRCYISYDRAIKITSRSNTISGAELNFPLIKIIIHRPCYVIIWTFRRFKFINGRVMYFQGAWSIINFPHIMTGHVIFICTNGIIYFYEYPFMRLLYMSCLHRYSIRKVIIWWNIIISWNICHFCFFIIFRY